MPWVVCLPGSGTGLQWRFEEGILDWGLLGVVFYERRRDDVSEGQPLAGGVVPSGVCLEARDSPGRGLMATGELGWKKTLEIRQGAPRGPTSLVL